MRLRNRTRRNRPLMLAVSGLAAGALAFGAVGGLLGASVALAQGMPGIIVMNPPQAPGGQPPMMPPQFPQPFAPPPALAPPPPAAAAEAAPRPKPKPKPKPVAKTLSSKVATADAEGGSTGGKAGTGIAVLVNGDPITNYEIDQRARLLGLQASDMGSRVQDNMKRLVQSESVNKRWKEIVEETIQANQGKTREQVIAIVQEKQKSFSMGLQKQAVDNARASVLPGQRDKAKQELVEELIKNQEAKKIGASPDEAMIENVVKDIAGRNKLTPQQFTQHFAQQGVDIATFKARFRAQQAWAEAIKRKFGHLVTTNNRDIDRLVQKGGTAEDQLELQLQRIIVPIPPKLDQKSMAQRLADAEQLHLQFAGCKSTTALAAKIEGARFENMGARKPTNFTEPTRTMLLNAKDEEMIPPSMTTSGIELIAVCGRKVVKATEELRNQKAAEIRQEEFERISKKHLRDVMADAVIENR